MDDRSDERELQDGHPYTYFHSREGRSELGPIGEGQTGGESCEASADDGDGNDKAESQPNITDSTCTHS